MSDGLPRLFDQDGLVQTRQLAHLADEDFGDHDGNDREENGIIFKFVYFKDDHSLIQQIQLLPRIQQKVIFAALIKGAQDVEKIIDVEIFLLNVLSSQHPDKFILQEFVKAIKAGKYRILRQPLIITLQRIAERYILRPEKGLVFSFPQRHQQGLDAFPFLRVQALTGCQIKRVEPD